MMKIIGIICIIMIGSSNCFCAEKIIMATGEWIPYTSKELENYGQFTNVVSIICKEMGVEPEYRFYPWRRCYDSVLKGRVWAAFPYSFSKQRSQEAWFTDQLSCSKTVFFYYSPSKPHPSYAYDKLEDLKNYKLGGVIGYYYEEIFKEAGLNVDYVNKEISGLEKLKLGRIDLMPFNEAVGKHLIQTHFPNEIDKFQTLPKGMDISSLHLVVSKTYPKSNGLLNRFNQAIKRCVEKGLITIPNCQ